MLYNQTKHFKNNFMTEKSSAVETIAELSSEQKRALAEISYTRQQCSIMGANSDEFPALAKLEQQVRQGTLDPQVAIENAQAILAAKSDYR